MEPKRVDGIAFTNRVPTINEMYLASQLSKLNVTTMPTLIALLLSRASTEEAKKAIGEAPGTELPALVGLMSEGLLEGYKLITLDVNWDLGLSPNA